MTEETRLRDRALLRGDIRQLVTSPEARARRRRNARTQAILWPLFLLATAWLLLQALSISSTFDTDPTNLPWWSKHVADNRLRPALQAELLLGSYTFSPNLRPRIDRLISSAEKAGAAPVVVDWLRWENAVPRNASAWHNPPTPAERQALAALLRADPNNPWWQILSGMIAAGDGNWAEANRLFRAAVANPAPVAIPELRAPWPWQTSPPSMAVLPEVGIASYANYPLELYGAALGMRGQRQRALDFAALMSRLTVKLAQARYEALSIGGGRTLESPAWNLMARYPMNARTYAMIYQTGHYAGPSSPTDQLARWQLYVAAHRSFDFGRHGYEAVIGTIATIGLIALVLWPRAVAPLLLLCLAPFLRRRSFISAFASVPLRLEVAGGLLVAAVGGGVVGAIEWHQFYRSDLPLGSFHVGALVVLILVFWLLPVVTMSAETGPVRRLHQRPMKRLGSGVWNKKLRPLRCAGIFGRAWFSGLAMVVLLASLVGYGAVEGAIHHDHSLLAIVEPAAAMHLSSEDWKAKHYGPAMAELKGALAATTVEQVKAAISPALAAQAEQDLSKPQPPWKHRADFEHSAALVAARLRRSALPPPHR